MHPVQNRFVELALARQHRALTRNEEQEYQESRQFIVDKMWQEQGPKARVMNLMWVARNTKDWNWMMELNQEREQLEKG